MKRIRLCRRCRLTAKYQLFPRRRERSAGFQDSRLKVRFRFLPRFPTSAVSFRGRSTPRATQLATQHTLMFHVLTETYGVTRVTVSC